MIELRRNAWRAAGRRAALFGCIAASTPSVSAADVPQLIRFWVPGATPVSLRWRAVLPGSPPQTNWLTTGMFDRAEDYPNNTDSATYVAFIRSSVFPEAPGPVELDGIVTVDSVFNDNEIRNVGTLKIASGGTLDNMDASGVLTLLSGDFASAGTGYVTHGFDHTIRGYGTISGRIVNRGLIDANDPAPGRTIFISGTPEPLLNYGTLRARDGGVLTFYDAQVTQTTTPTGEIVADGGTVSIGAGTRITGGRLMTVNGGVIVAGVGGGVVRDVDIFGTLRVDGSHFFGGTVGGTGTVVLNGGGLSPADGAAIPWTSGADLTVRGYGTIYRGFINRGVVDADVDGKTMNLLSLQNHGTLRARAGGTLLFAGVFDQHDGGQIVADGGTVSIDGRGFSLTGGRLVTLNGGTIGASGGTFRDVTNDGTVDAYSTLGGFTFGGTLGGSGQTILHGPSIYPADAAGWTNAHTVSGRGWLFGPVNNAGTFRADVPGHFLHFYAAVTNSGVLAAAAASQLTAAGGVVQTGGRIDVAGKFSAPSVNLQGGTLAVAAGGLAALSGSGSAAGLTDGLYVVGDALNLSGGLVSLDNGVLVWDYPAAGPSRAEAVRAALQAGRNGGTWDGATGITSAGAAADAAGRMAIGYAEAGQLRVGKWRGASVDASAVVTTLTWYGDANLDGQLSAEDLALLDRGYALGLAGWVNGDFDYDGVVGASDYLLADRVYGQLAGTLSPGLLARREAQFGPAYVAQLIPSVPEPSAANCGATVVMAWAGARKRRSLFTFSVAGGSSENRRRRIAGHSE